MAYGLPPPSSTSLSACSQLSLKPIPNPARTSRTSAPGQPADQDVADLVVHGVGPVHPTLLHEHALEPGAGGDGGDLAGVVGLHAADGDERVAALGERVGDEVLQLAGLVAAVRDTGVAVLALGPEGGAAEVRGQPLQRVHGRGPEEERVALERGKGHGILPGIESVGSARRVVLREPGAPDLRGDTDRLVHVTGRAGLDQLLVQPGRTAVAALTEAPSLQSADERGVAGDGGGGRAVATDPDEHVVQFVVGAQGASTSPVRTAAANRSLAERIVSTSAANSRGTAIRAASSCMAPTTAAASRTSEATTGRHPRVALRLALQQPLVDEPREGLPHGRPGQPEPLGEIGVPHRRARFDLPGHDGVPDRFVRPVPEQGAGYGPLWRPQLKC